MELPCVKSYQVQETELQIGIISPGVPQVSQVRWYPPSGVSQEFLQLIIFNHCNLFHFGLIHLGMANTNGENSSGIDSLFLVVFVCLRQIFRWILHVICTLCILYIYNIVIIIIVIIIYIYNCIHMEK